MIKRIQVTRRDIKMGDAFKPRSCAVALATKRDLAPALVAVGADNILIVADNSDIEYKNDTKLKHWIINWDMLKISFIGQILTKIFCKPILIELDDINKTAKIV